MTKKHTQKFLHVPRSWFELLDWHIVFGNSLPVEIDLGCGDGTFLVHRAGRHPERNFLGVERLLGRARKVDRKAQRLGLNNVRVLRIESSYAIGFLVPEASVSIYHIYFPDPWPKARHHKRRLFQPNFVAALAKTLVHDGEVRVASDHGEYFEEIVRLFREPGGWKEIPLEEPEADEQTDFEREFRSQNKAIHRMAFGLDRKLDLNRSESILA